MLDTQNQSPGNTLSKSDTGEVCRETPVQDYIFIKVTGLQSVTLSPWQVFSLAFCKNFQLVFVRGCLWIESTFTKK